MFRIISQPSSISLSEMVRGGVILTALFSIKSQKRIKPLFLASKTNLFAIAVSPVTDALCAS